MKSQCLKPYIRVEKKHDIKREWLVHGSMASINIANFCNAYAYSSFGQAIFLILSQPWANKTILPSKCSGKVSCSTSCVKCQNPYIRLNRTRVTHLQLSGFIKSKDLYMLSDSSKRPSLNKTDAICSLNDSLSTQQTKQT